MACSDSPCCFQNPVIPHIVNVLSGMQTVVYVFKLQTLGAEGYDALPPAGSKRRLSMSLNRKAPATKKHIPKAMGTATSRSLAIEYETVVSIAHFVPRNSPPPPMVQAATRRNGKFHSSLHPMGPNLLCSFKSIYSVL